MVRIPEYSRERLITATRTGPHATADQFGAQAGEALSQMGRAIAGLFASLGASLGRAQEQQDRLTAIQEWSKFEADTNKDLFTSMQDTPPDRMPSLPGEFIERYDQRASDMMTRIPQSQQARVGEFVARLRSSADVRISQQALRRSYDAQAMMIQQSAQQQAAALSENPGDMAAAIDRVVGMARNTQLPHWRQQEEIEAAYMTLLQSGRDAYIKRGDPDAAAAFVDKWLKMAPAYGFRTGQPGEMPVPETPSTPGGVPGASLRMELRPDERDAVVRTIYAEAADQGEQGWQAVAEVIRNRAVTGRWGGVEGVVSAPGQFEPWSTLEGRERMASLSPDSEQYQAIATVVDRVFAGEAQDITNGATHFYSPSAQRALGRKAPEWAKNRLAVVGGHEFYAPEGAVARRALPEVVQTEGLRYSKGEMKEVRGLVIHHTGGGGTVEGVIQTLNQRGLGVQFVIDRNGTIHQLMPENARGAHIRPDERVGGNLNNSNSIGVEIIAKDDNDVLPVQVQAAQRLASALMRRYGFTADAVVGHGEINSHKQTTEGQRAVQAIRSGGAVTTVSDRVTLPTGGGLDWQRFMRQNDAVIERARSLRSAEEARMRKELAAEIDADLRAILNGEPENDKLTSDRVAGLLSKGEFDLWHAKRQAAREFGSVMTGFEVKSEEEQVRAVESLKPQNDGGPDYSYRVALYNEAQRRLNNADAAREREARRDAARLYRDMRSRLGEAKLTRAELDDARDFLNDRQYDLLNRAMEVQERARDTPEALRALVIHMDTMDDDEFDRIAGAYLRRGQIRPDTYRHISELQERGGSPERAAIKQAIGGVDFVTPAAQRVMQDHMVEVLRGFDAADHPDRPPEERAALMQKAIAEGLAGIPQQRLRQTIGLSKYFQARDVAKVQPQDLSAAAQKLAAEVRLNRISGTELAQEVARISDWETLLGLQSAPRAAGGQAPASIKPARQPKEQPERQFYGGPPPHEILTDPAKTAEMMRRILPPDRPEVLEGREHIK